MKKFKGTPAPWNVEKLEKLTASGSYFLESSQGCVGTVWASSEQESNAHLIAAAPELLEALQEAVYWFDSNILDGVQQQTLDKAKQAINKALNL